MPKIAIFSLLLFFLIPLTVDKNKLNDNDREIISKANNLSVAITSIFFFIFLILSRFLHLFNLKLTSSDFNWIILLIAIFLISNGVSGIWIVKK